MIIFFNQILHSTLLGTCFYVLPSALLLFIFLTLDVVFQWVVMGISINSLIKADLFVVFCRSKSILLRIQDEWTYKLKFYPFNYACQKSVEFPFPVDAYGSPFPPPPLTCLLLKCGPALVLEFMFQVLAPKATQAIWHLPLNVGGIWAVIHQFCFVWEDL